MCELAEPFELAMELVVEQGQASLEGWASQEASLAEQAFEPLEPKDYRAEVPKEAERKGIEGRGRAAVERGHA